MNDLIESLGMMMDVANWPGSVLCLKRHSKKLGEWPEFAILHRDRLGPPVQLLDTEEGKLFFGTEEKRLVVLRTYPSLNALVEDGWRVD